MKEICLGTRSADCGNFRKKRSTSGYEAVVAQKSAKTVPRNDGEKDMSEVNLFRIKEAVREWLFFAISASGSDFNPQNTQCIPAVKIFAFLDLGKNFSFSDSLQGRYSSGSRGWAKSGKAGNDQVSESEEKLTADRCGKIFAGVYAGIMAG